MTQISFTLASIITDSDLLLTSINNNDEGFIEAKIEGDTCFKGENARAVETLFTTEFNVFIPNAQSNIDIRYDMKCN